MASDDFLAGQTETHSKDSSGERPSHGEQPSPSPQEQSHGAEELPSVGAEELPSVGAEELPSDPEAEAALRKIAELQKGHQIIAEEASERSAQMSSPTNPSETAPDRSPDTSSSDTPPSISPEAVLPASPQPSPSDKPASSEQKASFIDTITAYFNAAKGQGKNPFVAGLETFVFALTTGSAGLWQWIKETFGSLWGRKKENDEEKNDEEKNNEEENEPLYRIDDESFPDDKQKLFSAAEKQLKEVQAKNPTWIDFAREASKKYGVAPASILAIARFESSFNPTAKAAKSSAEGLGQFVKKTWAHFLEANPDFSEAKPSDPRGALYAIAWYAKVNAVSCSIDLDSEDATAALYLAHHEGAAGYKRLKAFQKGELSVEQIPPVPETYKGKAFPRFGVETVATYEDYVTLVTRMAARVQAVADRYSTLLETPPLV